MLYLVPLASVISNGSPFDPEQCTKAMEPHSPYFHTCLMKRLFEKKIISRRVGSFPYAVFPKSSSFPSKSNSSQLDQNCPVTRSSLQYLVAILLSGKYLPNINPPLTHKTCIFHSPKTAYHGNIGDISTTKPLYPLAIPAPRHQ